MKIISALLVVISACGLFFFRHYNGTLIPYPYLWMIGFGILGLAGAIKHLSSAPIAHLGEKMKTEAVLQSHFILNLKSGDETETFISQSFPFERTSLEFYVMNNNITLYVDRRNRSRYYFELKK